MYFADNALTSEHNSVHSVYRKLTKHRIVGNPKKLSLLTFQIKLSVYVVIFGKYLYE